ncbi:hypothetical protein V8F06_013160 [Rhypophila decipiens]
MWLAEISRSTELTASAHPTRASLDTTSDSGAAEPNNSTSDNGKLEGIAQDDTSLSAPVVPNTSQSSGGTSSGGQGRANYGVALALYHSYLRQKGREEGPLLVGGYFRVGLRIRTEKSSLQLSKTTFQTSIDTHDHVYRFISVTLDTGEGMEPQMVCLIRCHNGYGVFSELRPWQGWRRVCTVEVRLLQRFRGPVRASLDYQRIRKDTNHPEGVVRKQREGGAPNNRNPNSEDLVTSIHCPLQAADIGRGIERPINLLSRKRFIGAHRRDLLFRVLAPNDSVSPTLKHQDTRQQPYVLPESYPQPFPNS